MPWTREQQLSYLLRLPWTVAVERHEDGYWTAQVAEVPFVAATGVDERALGKDFFEALWSALDAMMEHGEILTLPQGVALPWEAGVEPQTRRPVIEANFLAVGSAWDRALTTSSLLESLAL